MRTLTSGLIIAGAALVAACGGGAANNTANAPADNGAMVSNEPAMAPMNEGMPGDNMSTNTTTAVDGNATTTTTTTTTTNTANGM